MILLYRYHALQTTDIVTSSLHTSSKHVISNPSRVYLTMELERTEKGIGLTREALLLYVNTSTHMDFMRHTGNDYVCAFFKKGRRYCYIVIKRSTSILLYSYKEKHVDIVI